MSKELDARVRVRDRLGAPAAVTRATYTLNVICTNCSYGGQVEMERGTRFQHGFSHSECPRCGCRTLIQTRRPTFGFAKGAAEPTKGVWFFEGTA